MAFFPQVGIYLLNGFILIIPLLFIRLVIPKYINKKSLSKLEYFPETIGFEKIALTTYFITNTFLIFSPIIIKIQIDYLWIGLIIYVVGAVFMLLSVITFSKDQNIVTKGIYKISRNPMYIGYFLIFIANSIIMNSVLYLTITVIYQIAVHFLIISEERWCQLVFKDEYLDYKKSTRRYL